MTGSELSAKYMYIHLAKYGHVRTNGMFLHIDDEHLERVKTTNFLGIYIDEHFTWKYII